MLKPDLSDGASRYGARMGRGTVEGDAMAHTAPVKVTLQRVRLNGGGYDSGGAYWGVGAPLYWAGSDDGLVDMWFRAPNRSMAKAKLRTRFPNAKFYN